MAGAAPDHDPEVFVPYRGAPAALGTGRLRLHVHAGDDVHVRAENGWRNDAPFTATLLPDDRGPHAPTR